MSDRKESKPHKKVPHLLLHILPQNSVNRGRWMPKLPTIWENLLGLNALITNVMPDEKLSGKQMKALIEFLNNTLTKRQLKELSNNIMADNKVVGTNCKDTLEAAYKKYEFYKKDPFYDPDGIILLF